jgi:hypothetical protein
MTVLHNYFGGMAVRDAVGHRAIRSKPRHAALTLVTWLSTSIPCPLTQTYHNLKNCSTPEVKEVVPDKKQTTILVSKKSLLPLISPAFLKN